MRIYGKCRKGFTVLELVIALSIAASLLAVTFSFFLPQQKALDDTTKRSQLQMDTQLILESITKSALEASKISSITSKDSAVVTSNLDLLSGIIDIRNISFLVENTNDDGEKNINYTYSYRIGEGSEEGKLFFSSTYPSAVVANKLIGDNIQSIKVEPVGGAFFSNCSGIKIIIEVKIKNSDVQTYKTESKIYFRNK